MSTIISEPVSLAQGTSHASQWSQVYIIDVLNLPIQATVPQRICDMHLTACVLFLYLPIISRFDRGDVSFIIISGALVCFYFY